MRVLFLAFYLGSFLLDAFLSCSGSNPPAPTKTMSFSVDGLTYNGAPNLLASQLPDSILVSTYVPQAAPSPPLTLFVKFPKAVGTFNFATLEAGSAGFDRSASNSTEKYYAGTKAGKVFGSGTITVTEYSGETVAGTFYFTGQDLNTGATKTISEGSFNTQVR